MIDTMYLCCVASLQGIRGPDGPTGYSGPPGPEGYPVCNRKHYFLFLNAPFLFHSLQNELKKQQKQLNRRQIFHYCIN